MTEPKPATIELRWGWRLRAAGLALALVCAALGAWALGDPASSSEAKIVSLSGAVIAAFVAVELFTMRTTIDERGLRRRSLAGRIEVAWRQVRVALLFTAEPRDGGVAHLRTVDPRAATHVVLRLDPPGARPWSFNAWMDGFPALVEALAERDLLGVVDPGEPPPSAAEALMDRGLKRLNRLNEGLYRVIAGFALVFVLLVAGLVLVVGADVSLTGDILIDAPLCSAILFGALVLVCGLLRALGAGRRPARGDFVPGGLGWTMSAAGLLGGLLLLIGFVPRALGGEVDKPWVDGVLAAVGAFLVYGALRDWLRGE
ncbi:MAG: hypothetical protein H6711_25220 [Myxococcales bacterium]|nr:hypothetical protein [Myxococcales bacterium]